VENTALDLGAIWEQAEYVHDLLIHNQSPVTEEIQDILPSCGCLSVEPRSLKIPSRGTARVRLKIDLVSRKPSEIGLAERPLVVEIWPLRKGSPQRQGGWQVRGIIKSRVTLDVLDLDFGDEPVRGQLPLSRKVNATIQVPDAKLRVRAIPESVIVVAQPRIGSANTFELTIAPKSLLAAGSFRCEVRIDLVRSSGKQLSGVVLPVSGRMRPEVRALPSRLVFGPKRIGETVEATVTLQAPTGEDWVVDHMEMESDDVRVARFANPRILSRQVFRIRQRISQTGLQSSMVRFFVRKGQAEPVPLTMEITYDGDKDGIVSETGDKGDKR
jgi:hypothetical protein